jgi:hypothetical protein
MYLLKFNAFGDKGTRCIRRVDLHLGELAVRLTCGSAAGSRSVETIPLDQGNLPAHITVLGRVVAILRQT